MVNVKQSDIIRRLGFNRRPRAKPVSETQSGLDPSHWASSGSLPSVSSNETRKSSITSSSSSTSSVNRRKPPLPPPHSSSKSNSEGSEHCEAQHACQNSSDKKPSLVTQQPTTPKLNPSVERTLVETQKRLEQEKHSSQTVTTEIYPRRRLASFAGLGSSGILSPHTSWGTPNHTQSQENHKGSKLTVPDQASSGSSSLRTSPKSSGRTTPVTTVSPLDLHLVRDQMVVALERLKEMEEQVKIIPVLQVKIAVLREEKKQLSALVKNLESQTLGCNLDPNLQGLIRKIANRTGSTANFSKPEKNDEFKRESGKNVDIWEHTDQFKQLNAEMQLIVNANVDMSEKFVHSRSCCRDVATETKLNVRSVDVGVTESMLGVVSDTELELEIQQQTIQVLREKVQTLEVELKEALLKAELCRLKSELQEAGAHTHAAKNYAQPNCAQPKMQSIATQTGMLTRSIGIGNHVQLVHAGVGEGAVQTFNTVGVTCQPETSDVASGLDTPTEMWEIQKKVEKRDQCIGIQYVPTYSQGVGTSLSVCDVGIMTFEFIETLEKKKTFSRTVGCGDSTIDANVNMVKPLVSHGIVTEPVRGIDNGVVITPQTMSQCINTDVNTVSRSTSTSQLYVSASSPIATNILTQERHTNTVHVLTRSLAVGDGKINDQQVTGKMRSIAVGTPVNLKEGTVTHGTPKVLTRDTGVGLANINENFLVGLRTRNMACGPSRLPDPNKTRSIGVEVGDGRIRDVDGHRWMPVHLLQPNLYAKTEPGLDHYIDRMQILLKEQQSLLTNSHFKPKDEVSLQPQHLPDTQYGGNAFSFRMFFI